MARQKSYVREDAVRKARNAFWEHGFQNLGIRAIEDTVGVGRFAIRTDFNGKEGLFLEALALYREELQYDIIQPIHDADDISILEELVIGMTKPQDKYCSEYGCFLANTLVENASLQNEKFRQYTSTYFSELLNSTSDLIKRAKAKGSVRNDVNPTHASEFFRGAMMTMSYLNRDAQDLSASAGYLEMALVTIDSWRKDS